MSKLAILNTHPIQYFAPLYRRLAQEPDLELTVYFCSRQGAVEYVDPGFGERIKWDVPLLEGHKHKFLKNLWRGDRVGGFWSLVNWGIVGELRKNRYDALMLNGHNHATYLLAILAACALRVPVLMRCETHLLLQRSAFKRAIRKPLMTFLYKRLCAACLPIGTRNRDFYLAHGVSEDRLFMVPYAVDNDYFTSAAEQVSDPIKLKQDLGLPLDRPLILFASKLLPRKRPLDLLAAFHRIQERGSNAALIFVGSGQQEMVLRSYAQARKLSDVYFFGFRNQSELPRFYSAADVFVFPSENEPWGLILNEVMCAGLPVIASREIGAVPDLVRHGENGFLFDSGNVDQLADYLEQLLTSAEMRKRMGKESRRIIKNWDYEACVRGVKQALARVEPKPKRLVINQAA